MKLNKNTTKATIILFTILFTSCFKKDAEHPSQTNSISSGQNTASAIAASNNNQTESKKTEFDFNTDSNGLSQSSIVMKTSKGTIKFRLYSKDAPNTVKRFVELVEQKFYNGLTFHRVVPDFVIQTGDPKSKNKNDPTIGNGGSGQKLKAEFNSRKHVRGTVAMARSMDPDSADSQFYITLGSFPHLDNQYTIFGLVYDFGEKVNGKDVIDRITQWDEIIEMKIE